MERNSRSIQSVERAMLLLEAIRNLGGSARLVEIAEAAGLSKSTAHGMLDTLVSLGYLSRERTLYSLGLRLRRLAQPLEEVEGGLRESFAPALRAFGELTGENCFLAVSGGVRSYLTLDALDASGRPLSLPADERRDALSTSAVGKVFLAHDRDLAHKLRRTQPLPQTLEEEMKVIRNRGFALDLGESERELHCLAIPLRMKGRVVAALSTSAPSERLTPAFMCRLASRAMREMFELIKC